ncbi:MAG: rod shape-determining protein MreC [Acidobacteria bacterium]|nr:rod shape-determining protein MreC [Acidobacteriota bacterium]
MDRRQRTGYLILAVVVGHLILISAQVKAGPRNSVLEQVTFGAFAEMQQMLTFAWSTAAGTWSDFLTLRDLQARNDTLAAEVDDLKLALQAQRALAHRARSLQALLDLRRDIELDTVSARVVAAGATPYIRTLTFDRGSAHGVVADAAVIAPDGVVGRVLGNPAWGASQVQLLNDRNAAAGARIERSRAAGIVRGSDDEHLMRMEFVSNTEDVRVGDRIVTSGIDGIYPPGFLIGEVSEVRHDSGLHLEISVVPAVEFTRLEVVLVVVGEHGPVAVVAENE